MQASNRKHRFLAFVGTILILGSLSWGYWFSPDQQTVFRKLRPTFVPPPGADTIPPVEKAVLKITAPKKLKIGTSAVISVEFYQYTILPYFDFSDTILKYLIGERKHPPYQISLETPSFEFAPQGKIATASIDQSPLRWKWVIEPKMLGKKKILIYLDENLFNKVSREQPKFENPFVISIEVVSETSLSSQTMYWLQRLSVFIGFVLGLPFLIPLFKKIRDKITTWLRYDKK